MSEHEMIEASDPNWKTKVLLIGGIIGLVSGLGAAYLLIQRSDKEETAPVLNLVEGLKLGLLVMGTLRQVSQLGEGK